MVTSDDMFEASRFCPILLRSCFKNFLASMRLIEAQMLDANDAANAKYEKLISLTEAMATPPKIGNRVRNVMGDIEPVPVSKDIAETNKGSLALTICTKLMAPAPNAVTDRRCNIENTALCFSTAE
ncbi:aconitate hydratase, putative [Babesia ovis]|uniref:Aconitate hydratase, putative n=1 Tax=Babesia ovis TaxID=5869 RepID=A0A9W5TAZ4_BABOV|nr:aconitate hydratase, putative [Babesia ovis]